MVREIRDADEIFRHAPEPIAFARALRDLLLQGFVELLQRQLGTLTVSDVDVRPDETQRIPFSVALDLGAHMNPAYLSVARTNDAVLRPIFAGAATNRPNEGLFVLFPVLRMDAANPIFVGLVDSFRRQPVNLQVFGRAAILETVSEKDLDATDLSDFLYAREFGFTLTQCTFGPNAVGRLDGGDQHAADARRRRLVGDRRVAHREVRILHLHAAAADAQQHVLGEHRLALAGQEIVMQRAELVLHLGPDFAKARAERFRVLRAEDRQVAVIVDDHELRPPAQRHGELRRHHRCDDELEAWRPRFARAEGRLRPIKSCDPCGHFASRIGRRTL